MSSKSLHNTTANGARKNVKDIQFWGNGDTFMLISKASSEKEGWMKSTKAMPAGSSVVVQVTTQQRGAGVTRMLSKDELIAKHGESHPTFEQVVEFNYNVAEALTTVPNAIIVEHTDEEGTVIARSIDGRAPRDSGLTIRKEIVKNGSN
jgi:tagatose-1,6-bisphosphate aldolase